MKKFVLGIFFTSLLFATSAWACDPCAIFNAARLDGHEPNSWRVSLGEQYTNFKKGKSYPENSFRNKELVKGFSNTQFALSYDFSEVLGLQLSIPLISRYVEEIKDYQTSNNWDAGLGDISLIASYSPVHIKKLDWTVLTGVSAGIKLPTGDTGVLEEISADPDAQVKAQFLKHHPVGSTSGGRALTYGSGSYDYIMGANNLLRYQNFLLLSNIQYTIRTEGDFNYEFDNDLIWAVLPAYYLLLEHDYTVASGLGLSGEHKGKDRLAGSELDGSDISNIYLGPELILSFKGKYSAQIGFDFRVSNKDREADIVPENRVRASLAYRF